MQNPILPWVLFNVFILALLILDFRLFHREDHTIGIREAVLLSAGWIALALLFNLGIYFFGGAELALSFLAGYLIEKSLSVDNLFVFLLIFSYFNAPPKYQHKALFWGILGALIMRAIFIFAGITLIRRFHWIIYVFGPFLIITALRMLVEKEREIHPEKNPALKLLRRFMRVTQDYENGRFFVRDSEGISATPLFVVLVVIETTDLIFAVDSIPAILAVTSDPFIVYTSNVFAILGLRALFFALAGAMTLFRHLKFGVSAILAFVGVKMMLSDFYRIPIGIALAIIGGILLVSILASVLLPKSPQSGTDT